MRTGTLRVCAIALFISTAASLCAQTPVPPVSIDPATLIFDAFRTHTLVGVSDPHGNLQMQQLLLSLVRDPRFLQNVDDIVLETMSSRYQDAIDRYVRGDDVPRAVIRKAWEDHTVVNSLGGQAAELIDAIRAINAGASGPRKLRLIAGDPPIDWENVTSQADHRRWIDLRDSYPADLIRHQVIDRGRRALIVYGQMHLQRRQLASNYDMSIWQAQTVVSLVEHDAGVHVFTVWTLFDEGVPQPDAVKSWRAPSAASLKETTLGAEDFASYTNGLGTRFGIINGQPGPIPRDQWKMLRMEDQFDAVLYLGPPTSLSGQGMPPGLCADAKFVTERIDRLTRFAPPQELAAFKAACAR